MEDTSQESQKQMSSDRKRSGTQAERGETETETMEGDVAQPELDPQPLRLPAGSSKDVRPRARPLNRAKSQAHVESPNCSVDMHVDTTAKGDYTLMAFQRLATNAY